MSRLSNLTTIKIGIFKSWNAYWFDKVHYASLLFNDLKIRDYITGLFYRLKIISDYIYLYRFFNNNIIIKSNLIFFSNLKFKTISLRKVYHLNEQFVFFYRKKLWNRFIIAMKLFQDFFVIKEKDKYGILSKRTGNLSLLCTRVSVNIFTFSSFLNYFYILYSFCYYYTSYKCLANFIHFNFYNVSNVSLNSSFFSPSVFMYNSSFYSLFNTIFFSLQSYSLYSKNWLFIDWINSSYLNIIRLDLFYLIKYIFYFFINSLRLTSLFELVKDLFSFSLSFLNINFLKVEYSYFFSSFPLQPIILGISRRSITQALFILFRNQIERSISLFEQQNIYFNMSISFKRNPFIISAKLITDCLVYLLQAGKPVVKSFFFIKNWQAALYASRRRLEYLYYQHSSKYIINLNYLFLYAVKRSPVIGIRIECSGTFKKGRMSRVYFYNSWVKNDILTGKMPNNTLIADIDYYQYFAITKGSSIGIKTWIFLETHIYNNNHKYISLVY
jgi:hypothetical protein